MPSDTEDNDNEGENTEHDKLEKENCKAKHHNIMDDFDENGRPIYPDSDTD